MQDAEIGFAVQLKPVGSACNINCRYCYVEQFRQGKTKIMPEAILERVIASCVNGSSHPTFSWHGGEPTLAGLAFFGKAVSFMEKYSKGREVRNVLQTNATLITPAFSRFLSDSGFGVSVSLDGPEHIHGINRFRRKSSEQTVSTFVEATRGIDRLRDAGIAPAVICTVDRNTLTYAKEVFHFLVESGFTEIKYSPVFDSTLDSFSLSPEEWFGYLQAVFQEWFEMADAELHVRDLDEVIAWIQHKPLSMCSSDQTCLRWVSVDPDGNLYPCEYLRVNRSYGNIHSMELADIVGTEAYRSFCADFLGVAEECRQCQFFAECGNGCPATRVRDGKITSRGLYIYCNQRRMLYNVIKQSFEQGLGHSL